MTDLLSSALISTLLSMWFTTAAWRVREDARISIGIKEKRLMVGP